MGSVVARLVLSEGFADVSFGIGEWRGWKALGLALIFRILVGLVSYCIAVATGLVRLFRGSRLSYRRARCVGLGQ